MAYTQRNQKRMRRSKETIGNGIYVAVQDGNVEKAIKRFKKKVQESGILDEYRAKKEYVKPSTRKRLAKNAAKRRATKQRLKDEAEGLNGPYSNTPRKGKKK